MVEIERRLYCYKIEKQKRIFARKTAKEFYKKPKSITSKQSRGSRRSKQSTARRMKG